MLPKNGIIRTSRIDKIKVKKSIEISKTSIGLCCKKHVKIFLKSPPYISYGFTVFLDEKEVGTNEKCKFCSREKDKKFKKCKIKNCKGVINTMDRSIAQVYKSLLFCNNIEEWLKPDIIVGNWVYCCTRGHIFK